MSEFVEYRVGLGSRARHLYEVEARFPTGGSASLELRLPVWTPGSYLIREYQRNLQDLTCADEHGRALPVRKVAKARWQVECAGAASVRASYRVYAHEVTVRTSHLDDTHAYWNGATLFVYVDSLRAAPVRVMVEDVPAGWRIATALAADAERPHLLHATDHDMLVDSPVEVGAHERLEFVAAGKPHAVAIWGRAAAATPPPEGSDWRDRLTTDLRAIIESQAQLFGETPYDRYTFLLHLVPGGYGGLEHKSSCTVLASPYAFSKEKSYQDLLELLSHEFLHLWNGKRIRPAALGPFDYQQECHTRSLWVVEGWTSYYDRWFLRRSGRISAERYLEKLGEDLGKLLRIPGREHQSLEESSWDAWIKLYRPDENTLNTTVSYYLKGSVVALLLDLEIRRLTAGQRSLDDVLRALWREHQRTGAGYADEALQGLVEEAAGCALGDFFERAVRGRGDPDFDGALGYVGLRLKRTADTDDDDREGGWLGANVKMEGRRLKVSEALEGGPAQQGNLYAGDEIVALDGWRVDDSSLNERLRALRPGDGVRITLFRRDQLREAQVTLGRRPRDQVEIEAVKNATDEAKQAYAAWLGEPWKE